jgi:copper chaperone CopZ
MLMEVLKILLLLAVIGGTLRAEFLHVEVFIRDMNCEPCSDNLSAAFKKMRGVDRVNVDFKAGTVALDLAPQNRLGVEQVWDAIKRVGFTPGETKVVVRGAVKGSKLEVPEVNKTFELEGRVQEGESVEIKGSITPPATPREGVKIRIN